MTVEPRGGAPHAQASNTLCVDLAEVREILCKDGVDALPTVPYLHRRLIRPCVRRMDHHGPFQVAPLDPDEAVPRT